MRSSSRIVQILMSLFGLFMSFSVLAVEPVHHHAGLASTPAGMTSLSDEELSKTEAQALFNLSYLAPGDTNNPYGTASNIGFYTLGMEAEVSLNANIRNLQLGCGGVNGAGDCDLDISNFSLGCIANSAGVCVSLPPTGNQVAGKVADTAGNQTQMKDFVLTNPFYQFAIRNPNSASTREIIGMRIGAATVNGPMSFGSLNTFSGYLTGKGNLTMRGQGPNGTYSGRTISGNLNASQTPDGITDQEDVAATCKTPALCPDVAGRSDYTGMVDYRYMGLDNQCVDFIFPCVAELNQVALGFMTVNRTNLPVTASGNRQKQAFVANANLGNATNTVNGVAQDGVVLSITNTMAITRTTNFFGSGIINAILGALETQIGNKITQQLADGFGTTVAALNNNSFLLPYNVANVHQLDISSNAFGISVQKQDLQYPGYVAAVSRGWALYSPDAFTLTINRRTTEFVQGITASTDARDGNIVGLEPPYRNCWGTLTFC